VAAALGISAGVCAQEIVKVPATQAPSVSRPDDLFRLPPGEWHFARLLWEGSEPCSEESCEAGFTTGDLVVSVERSKQYARIIAGLRGCEATAYSEMDIGKKPSKSKSKKLAKQVQTVVKGLGKSCKLTVPAVAPLDALRLYPAAPPPASGPAAEPVGSQ
jgi:hypothetical protein